SSELNHGDTEAQRRAPANGVSLCLCASVVNLLAFENWGDCHEPSSAKPPRPARGSGFPGAAGGERRADRAAVPTGGVSAGAAGRAARRGGVVWGARRRATRA